MEKLWYNVLQFHRQVAIFLSDCRLVDIKHLLEMGQELLKEDIGEEKVQILFSMAGACEVISDKRALEYWDMIIDKSPTDNYLLQALLCKAMFYMKINEKPKGKEIGDLLMTKSKECTNNTYMMRAWEFYGKVDFEDCNYNSALDDYSEMYFYAKAIDDKLAQYRALAKLGIIWYKLGDNGVALSNLMKANMIALEAHHTINIVIAEFLRGRILANSGKHELASKNFEDCENILENYL